jgi:hypothetical protein
LTDDDLVINRGTVNGVREDMIFDALTETARIVAEIPKTSRLTGEVWPEGV